MSATLGNAVGTYGGFKKMSEGAKMQREAQSAIDNFNWNDLGNAYDGLSASTKGTKLRMEEIARTSRTAMDNLRESGTRGVVAGTGNIQENVDNITRGITGELDQRQDRINFASAGQEMKNQDTISQRKTDELAGYGQMMNVGLGMKYGGYADVMNAGNAQSEHMQNIMNTFIPFVG